MTTDTIERPTHKTELTEIPRIYANGENDDVPGLVAALKNLALEYDGQVYKPGEDIAVSGRHLRLSARLHILGPYAEPVDYIGELKEGPLVVVHTGERLGRHVAIMHCVIEMLDTPEWTWPR